MVTTPYCISRQYIRIMHFQPTLLRAATPFREQIGAADEIVQADAFIARSVESSYGPVSELSLRVYKG